MVKILLRLMYAICLTLFTTAHLSASQIAGDTLVCSGESRIYSLAGGNVLVWEVSGMHLNVQLPDRSIQVIWNQPGNYFIKCVFQDSQNVIDTAYQNIYVLPVPEPEITPLNPNSCATRSVEIEGEENDAPYVPFTCYTVCDSGIYSYAVQGDSGSTFVWTSAQNSTITLNGTGDTAQVSWSGIGYTSLVVTETSPSGCVSSTEICINVIDNPIACFSSVPADSSGVISLCLNSTLTLNDACSDAPYGSFINRRTWSFGDGTVVANKSLVEHTYSSAGIYQLMLIVESNCFCKDTFLRTIVVDSSTGPDISCINTVCHDSVSIFTTLDTCSSLLWSVQGGTAISSLTDDSLTVQWGNGNLGYGIVELTSFCAGSCPYPTRAYVPIVPDTSFISGERIVCDHTTEIYSLPLVPSTFYTWCNPYVSTTCQAMPGNNSNEISITWHSGGEELPLDKYKVKVHYTNPFLGCSGYSEISIIIANPILVTGDTIICANDTGSLTAWDTTAMVHSHWGLYSNLSGALVDSLTNKQTAVFSGLSAGYYTLYTYPASGDYCATPVVTPVRVIQPPTTPSQTIAGPNTVCANNLVSYVTSAAISGTYWEWHAASGIPATGVGEHFSTMWTSPDPSDTLKLRRVMIAEPGCASDWQFMTIYPDNDNKPEITGDSSVCGDDVVSYEAGIDADFYKWWIEAPELGSVSSGQHSRDITIQWNRYTGSTSTTANIIVEIEKCGTLYKDTLVVEINGVPNVTINASTSPYCVLEEIVFSTSISGSSYFWRFGDGDSSYAANPTHQYATDGTFPVLLTFSPTNGCSPFTVSRTVDILPAPAAWLSTPEFTAHCTSSGWQDTLYTTLQNMNGLGITYELFKDTISQGAADTLTQFIVNEGGTYKVKITSAAGCSGFTNEVLITDTCIGVNDCVTEDTIGFTYEVDCGLITVQAVYSSGTNFSYFYFGDGSNVVYDEDPTHQYSGAGYYEVSVYGSAPETLGSDTCVVMKSGSVHVPLVPAFTVQFECESDTLKTKLVDVSTYIGTSISERRWYIDNTLVATQQDTAIALSPGSHVVKLWLSCSLDTCEVFDTINVPAPAVASFTSIDSVCESTAVQFTSTSTPTDDIVSYLWDYGDGSYSALPNSSKMFDCDPDEFNPNSCSQDVSLIVYDSYGCLSNSLQAVLVFDDKMITAEIEFGPDFVSDCIGVDTLVTVIVVGSLPNSPYNFAWSDSYTGLSTDDTVKYLIQSSGSYRVTLTDKFGCVTSIGTANAYFEDVSGAIRGDTLFCGDEVINLSIFAGHDYSYQWLIQLRNDTIVSETFVNDKPYLFDYRMSSYYDSATLWGIITSPNGCSDTVGPVTIHGYGNIIPDLELGVYPDPPCFNDGPVSLFVTGTNIRDVLWSNGVIGDTFVVTSPGTFRLDVIDTNGCNAGNGSLTASPGPAFHQLISGCYTRCLGTPIELFGPVPPINHGYGYSWILNDSALVSHAQNPVVNVSGTYTLVISDTSLLNETVCVDTSEPIFLELIQCQNTCITEYEEPCSSCYIDSASNTRHVTVVLEFNYQPSGPNPFTAFCNTDTVNWSYNSTEMGGQALNDHVVQGLNRVRVDVADTYPFSATLTIAIVVGECYFYFNIDASELCTHEN